MPEHTILAPPAADSPASTSAARLAAARRLLDELGVDPTELAAADAPTVWVLIDQCLSLLTSRRSAATFRTHLERFGRGAGPVCDQLCEPCMDPGTPWRAHDDTRRLRRDDSFVCRCGCAKCLASRLELEPAGDRRVGSDVLTEEAVTAVALIARRIAVKHGVLDNRARATRGLRQKPADGIGAQESAISAMRRLFRSARRQLDGENPALEVAKPRRPSDSRRALCDFELVELYDLTACGGDDPELDTLLVDVGLETGARREGAVNLVVGRIHRSEQLVTLIDKYQRPQQAPVSAELVERLLAHAVARGGPVCDPDDTALRPDAPVFWYRQRTTGIFRPITSRRFDTLHKRWQTSLGWGRDLGVT